MPEIPPQKESASVIYIARLRTHTHLPFGETDMPRVTQPRNIFIFMGDKSPKANQKKNSQKQAIANNVELKRKQAEQARTAAIKKR